MGYRTYFCNNHATSFLKYKQIFPRIQLLIAVSVAGYIILYYPFLHLQICVWEFITKEILSCYF